MHDRLSHCCGYSRVRLDGGGNDWLRLRIGNVLTWTNTCGAGPLVGKVDIRVGEIVKVRMCMFVK